MEEGDRSTARRVVVSDCRGQDRFFRAAWHPEQSVVVLSHWHNGVCVATSEVDIADLPGLVGLLVGAVRDADPYAGRHRDLGRHVAVGGD